MGEVRAVATFVRALKDSEIVEAARAQVEVNVPVVAERNNNA